MAFLNWRYQGNALIEPSEREKHFHEGRFSGSIDGMRRRFYI